LQDLSRGSEDTNLVDAQLFLDARHVCHDFFEALFPEKFLLLFLEGIPQGVIFLGGDDGVKGGKKVRIFPGFVGTIHPGKKAEILRQLFSPLPVFDPVRGGGFQDLLCQAAAGLMLFL
jgi:hypothetical protein